MPLYRGAVTIGLGAIECGRTDDLMRLIGAQTRVDLPMS